MNIHEIWNHAQIYIKTDINSPVAYNTYLKDAFPISYESDVFTLAVSFPIKKNIIEIKYKKIIESAVSRIMGLPVLINLIVAERPAEIPQVQPVVVEQIVTTTPPKTDTFPKSNLNPIYTLENFVVGKSNSYAFAAAENVVNFPAQNNNPLFLYGKSGLGKTHLMQAIGNEILKRNPNMSVLYVTSEQFTNDMINFLKEKNMEAFRRHYRDVDVLLVDDVQFIEGKEGTQEEFFHTFNELHMKNKQIVLTSDRKPKDLITLEERLRTRFEWGIAIDVVIPDYETRVAILRKKAESMNINVDNEIFEYIAQRVNSNVRELEGALSQIIAYAGISHKGIDIDLAEFALSSIIPDEIKITPQKIIECVCEFYKLKPEDLKGPSRVKEVVTPRHIAMYLCKTLTDMNFVTIAKVFGNRDRTSVMHGVDRIMKIIQTDSNLKSEIDFISKDLNP
ncbi:MAG: chromosomal replication initiator protein DnaA [Clostridia bacterium]|nr:chromosomal replication initiator protein DnaA [Clostridia bacterium]